MLLQLQRFFALALLVTCTAANAQYKHDSLKTATGYLHYYTKGKGEPLVLLQGGPGFSSYYMRALADSLNNHLCVLIDYEGTGRSQYRQPDSSWVSPEKVVADVELVRKKLAINQWTVLGHSYGTHFGLLYSIQHPAAVKKIILLAFIGTNNLFQRYAGDNVTSRLSEADLEGLAKIEKDTLMGPAEREFQTQSIILKGYFYDRSKVIPMLKSIPENENAFFFSDRFNYSYWLNKNYWTWDITKASLSLTKPIRIIQGRQDFVNDGNQTLFNSKARNSKLTYIEQSGHFPWMEKPAEFFTLLRRALKEQ